MDNELGLERACFPQRLENGDQIAGGGADIVHGTHDLIEFHAGLETRNMRFDPWSTLMVELLSTTVCPSLENGFG